MKILKDLLSQPANKKCLECDQRGPTYVDVTIGSFVCTSCGGILRGLNPPHRVKSISMTTFTAAEITFIESRGNEWCRAVYLAKYDEQSRAKPDSRNDQAKLKHFLELKYEQKRWYESPSQQRKLMESVAAAAKKNRENASPPAVRPLNSLIGNSAKTVQIPSAKLEISKGIAESKINKPLPDLLGNMNPPQLLSPGATTQPTNAMQRPQQPTANANSSGFSDGFADFDRAFGGFAPASSAQPSFAAFGMSSEPMAFTNDSSSNATNAAPPTNSGVDKYAALADLDQLFGKPETKPVDSMNDFSWSSPANQVFPQNQPSAAPQSQSVFGLTQPQAQQQNNFFNSAPMANQNPASSASWMTVPATSSWSSSTNNWNPSANWQPTYQQPPANNPPVNSNPFFSPAATPQTNVFGQVSATGSEFGAWTQPQHAAPAQGVYSARATAMSSTNPFAVGAAAPQSQPAFFQQQQPVQNLQPMANSQSNPFMF